MWWLIAMIGAGVGFVAGLFGAGGSAVGTPLLHAAGVPAFAAIASPLPVAIPLAASAALAYRGTGLISRAVLVRTLWFGVPATIAGALLTPLVGGTALIAVTDVVVVLIGIRFLAAAPLPERSGHAPRIGLARVAGVAIAVGLLGGLLGNSGGFLLVPLFVLVLDLDLKAALATSLAASAILAIPGTITHAALGHIDWTVVVVYGVAAVPAAYLGARFAMHVPTTRLGRAYGAFLAVLGGVLLIVLV